MYLDSVEKDEMGLCACPYRIPPMPPPPPPRKPATCARTSAATRTISTTGARVKADSIVVITGDSLIPPAVDGSADWTWLKIKIPTMRVTLAVTSALKDIIWSARRVTRVLPSVGRLSAMVHLWYRGNIYNRFYEN